MSQAGTLDQFLAALDSVDVFKQKIFRATSPAEMQAAQAGLARVTHELSQQFPQFNDDLIKEFRTAYKESGGTGTVPKNFYQKAYRSRVKAKEGFSRATTGIRQWGDEYSRDRAIIKAREDYKRRIKAAERSGDRLQLDKLKRGLAEIPEAKGVGLDPSIKYFKKSKNGKVYETWLPADQYMRMATASAYGIQRNLGMLAAFSKVSKWVLVLDGPGCGTKTHRDGQIANGQVWPVEQAMTYPKAHPHCRRNFVISDGPPGSKESKKQMRQLDMVHEKAGITHYGSLTAIARGVAGAGMVASIGGQAISNPFIQRFMREIIRDANIDLSPLAQRFLNRLSSYAASEARAFENTGKALGATTQEEFNRLVANSFDEDFATRSFLEKDMSETVLLRQSQSQVLGLSTRPTKAQLLDRLDDYGDWILHRDAIAKTLDERLQSAVNFSHANEELYRTAALKFHIQPGPGINAHRNWYNIIHKLKDTYDTNPARAERDLIRLGASVLDPLPWLRFPLAPGLRFTVGMTAQGRGDLAVRIFDQISKSRYLSPEEIKWAQALGMDMLQFVEPETIKVRHVINTFQPRITFQPGGLFSASFARVNGHIVPLIRLYPDGTFGRYLSLESKLRAGAIEDFITEFRKGVDLDAKERFINAFNTVTKEDFITNINLWRNSPLQLNLRMLGVTPDSYAIRAMPENDYVRYNYRFMLDLGRRTELEKEVRRRLLAGEDIDDIIELLSGGHADGTAAVARREAARIVKKERENWLEGFTILPGLNGGLSGIGGGFTLNGFSLSQREVIMKMKLLGNNLLIISKNTRYGYDNLLEMWQNDKYIFQDFIQTVSEHDLRNIRSFGDATRLFGDALRTKSSRISNIMNADLENVSLDFVNTDVRQYPSLRKDLQRFRLAWERQFPGGPLPEVEIADGLTNPLEAKPGVILIRRDVAEDWDIIGTLRRKSVRIGHFAPDTNDNVNNLIHEGAHAIITQMNKREKAVLLRKMLGTRAWPRMGPLGSMDYDFIRNRFFANPKIRQMLARRVSAYGATDPDELIAEALTEYFGSSNPRAMAQALGDSFTEFISPQASDFQAQKFGKKYGWETITKKGDLEAIEAIRMDMWDMRLAIDEGELVSGARAESTHKPTWWFFDNVSPELEDLEIDKILLSNQDLADDIEEGMERILAQFPQVKLPRIAYHPTTMQGPASFVNGAHMYYHRMEKYLYVTQQLFENYDLGVEIRNLGARVGASPRLTGRGFNTIIHEMGHVLTDRLNEQEFLQVIDFIRTSDLVDIKTRQAFHDVRDQIVREGARAGVNSRDLQNMVADKVSPAIGRDRIIKAKLSTYANENFFEFLAELFLDGMTNIDFGQNTTSAQFIRLLQSFGLP